MVKLYLWNSVARRRRSISDTFYDNGLGTLRAYLTERGHEVEVIDWATDSFFDSLSLLWLTKIIRKIYVCIFKVKLKPVKIILGIIGMQLQDELSAVQARRMKKKINLLVEELREKQIRIFGIKTWYGEAFTNAKYIAERIRQRIPDAIVIAGGYHVTLYEEKLLEVSTFDLGVACEGEFALDTILNIANKYASSWDKQKALDEIITLAGSNKLENLIYRKDNKIIKSERRRLDAHSLKSFPVYDPSQDKVRIHVMIESLGCDWGKCNFCVHPYFYPNYSLRDPDQIANEIEQMRKFGIGIFRFAGSDTPPAFGAKIARKITEKKMRVIFGMGSRALRNARNSHDSLVTSYRELIRAGLRALFMGGECGNDFINEHAMNKGINFDDLCATIEALRQAEKEEGQKVFLSLALIYPTPLLGKLTLEQVKEDNLRLLKATKPDSVMITPPGPFLHTRWYEDKERFGFSLGDDIISTAMEYEYVLYKPPSLWPKLPISLEGKPFSKILSECNDFRNQVEKELLIPTDISDEHFLMFYAAGLVPPDELTQAKNETMLDIVSCEYSYTRKLSRITNEFSKKISQEVIS